MGGEHRWDPQAMGHEPSQNSRFGGVSRQQVGPETLEGGLDFPYRPEVSHRRDWGAEVLQNYDRNLLSLKVL
jgi:hypothetical protein